MADSSHHKFDDLSSARESIHRGHLGDGLRLKAGETTSHPGQQVSSGPPSMPKCTPLPSEEQDNQEAFDEKYYRDRQEFRQRVLQRVECEMRELAGWEAAHKGGNCLCASPTNTSTSVSTGTATSSERKPYDGLIELYCRECGKVNLLHPTLRRAGPLDQTRRERCRWCGACLPVL